MLVSLIVECTIIITDQLWWPGPLLVTSHMVKGTLVPAHMEVTSDQWRHDTGLRSDLRVVSLKHDTGLGPGHPLDQIN